MSQWHITPESYLEKGKFWVRNNFRQNVHRHQPEMYSFSVQDMIRFIFFWFGVFFYMWFRSTGVGWGRNKWKRKTNSIEKERNSSIIQWFKWSNEAWNRKFITFIFAFVYVNGDWWTISYFGHRAPVLFFLWQFSMSFHIFSSIYIVDWVTKLLNGQKKIHFHPNYVVSCDLDFFFFFLACVSLFPYFSFFLWMSLSLVSHFLELQTICNFQSGYQTLSYNLRFKIHSSHMLFLFIDRKKENKRGKRKKKPYKNSNKTEQNYV